MTPAAALRLISALIGASAIALASSAVRPAAAEPVEQFYKGRALTMLVGNSPGGINDISARLVARHLSRFIPGAPTIVVQNNPGAGGLITANRLYFNADRDGSVLAKLERAVPQLAILGNPNAQFDPAKFTWLGSLSSYASDAYLMLVNAHHPAMSVADLKSAGLSVALGADNAASSNLIFAVIAREVLALIEFAELPFFMALPFAAPPEIPPDRAEALQTAFTAMCVDTAFLEEAQKLGIEMSPITGQQILRLLAETAAMPPDMITRYNRIAEKK